MSNFCTRCGAQLQEGAGFCTECGAKLDAEEAVSVIAASETIPDQNPVAVESAPAPEAAQPPVAAPESEPAAEPVKPAKVKKAKADRVYPVAGMGTYFGLMALFAIPVIGFIACLILSFAHRNKNVRNFALATLIWMIIGLVVLGLVIWAVSALIQTATDYISQLTDGKFQELGQLFEELKELAGDLGNLGDLSGITDQTVPDGLENLPIG